MQDGNIKLPLEGITVLDLTQALAGPMCAAVLSDFGARVIKVETLSGDPSRVMNATESMNRAYVGGDSFQGFNRNKEDIALDLKSPEGHEIILKLLKEADVLLSNYRPGVMERRNLGYEEVKKVNPNIIYAKITGFGNGIWAEEAGMDIVVQARTGTIGCTGTKDFLVKPGVSIADMSGGMNMVQGILLALLYRERTGRGQEVTVSLQESTLLMFGQYAAPLLNNPDYELKPLGLGHPDLVPCQALTASDGYVFVAVGTPSLWLSFCKAIDRMDLTEDPRFLDNQCRMQHRDELTKILNEAFLQKTRCEWETILEKYGVPVSLILTPKQAFAQAERDKLSVVAKVEHPVYGPLKVLGYGPKLSASPAQIRRAAPCLGQDTNEILASIGYSEAEIQDMSKKGVIYKYHN